MMPRGGEEVLKNWRWLLPGLGLILIPSLAPLRAGEISGPDLARRLGCFACHALNSQGGKIASPLDHIGSRLSAGDLKTALTHPRRRHPGAKMPNYHHLRPQELQVLTEYLMSFK
jgi:cbb3-type cytochrome oxidase cytochrome c subunit